MGPYSEERQLQREKNLIRASLKWESQFKKEEK